MANPLISNVRFYKLSTLPVFNVSKHVGVFVHLIPTKGETHKAGLWFGGATSWEYLTNDTSPESINTAITTAIQALDVTGYAQAEINTNVPIEGQPSSSTLTIYGIKEDNGKINLDGTKNYNIAIDGVYNNDTNKIATKSTVTNVINGLNAGTIQAVTKTTSDNNTTLTFKGVKETNGVITQGDGADTFIVGDAKLKIQIGSNESGAFEVFSANKQIDSTIQLDGNVFKKDDNNVISVITKSAVASNNKLVTEQDIARLSSAMYYKGSIASDTNWPATESVAAGDVYIATGNFEKNGNTIESGDMIVFGDNGSFTVVQSNITLGTGDGQIAKNVGVLATNNNVVVATSEGIKTIGISESDLTGTTDGNNTRTLSIANGTVDGLLYHDVTITDTFKVIGKDFNQSINISSTNRSIEIAKNDTDTGVVVDLVWNTTIE